MDKSDETFRDKLLEIEKPNVNYKEKYEKEIQAMLEKKLTSLGRAGFAVLAIVGLLAAIQFGGPAFSKLPANEVGFFIRAVTVPGLVLALAWAALMGWVAVKGTFNLRTQAPAIAGICLLLGFFFIAEMMFMFVVPVTFENPIDWRSIFGTQLALMAFFFLITIALCVILSILYRTEFRTREKLLEIEYHLAELAEKIQGKPQKKGGEG